MNITVIMRQVPDLVEPLQIDASARRLDLDEATFIVNEADDHALEQALLLKEAVGGEIVVVALDFGDVDNTLYSAAAKGADRVIKILWEEEDAPSPRRAAAMLAGPVRELNADLVLVGSWSHDELDGSLAPELAHLLELPYVGVIRGIQLEEHAASAKVFKEFPGAVMARLDVRFPAVIGVLAAEQPPRYVPVSRIRSVMKSMEFEQRESDVPAVVSSSVIQKFYLPTASQRAEMLQGSETEVADRIVEILKDKGLLT